MCHETDAKDGSHWCSFISNEKNDEDGNVIDLHGSLRSKTQVEWDVVISGDSHGRRAKQALNECV